MLGLFQLKIVRCAQKCCFTGVAMSIAMSAFGVDVLEEGFTPDPFIIELRAGGSFSAADIDPACNGYVAESASYSFEYRPDDNLVLGLYLGESAADTTLAVQDPGGQWHCSDDYSETSAGAPGVRIAEPSGGIYKVWAGVFAEVEMGTPVELAITETGLPWIVSGKTPDRVMEGGFRPDPFSIGLLPGGTVDAAYLGPECRGYVFRESDYAFEYQPSVYTLSVYVASSVDTTLVVRTPSGEYMCNDDHAGNSQGNPGIRFEDPSVGVYEVWVGLYSFGDWSELNTATLYISEASISNDAGPAISTGTGFFVSSSGHLLTNQHVVDSCSSVTIRRAGGEEMSARLVSANEDSDLALLKVDDVGGAHAIFRAAPSVSLGDEVVVFGFPRSGEISSGGNLTSGLVSGLSGLHDDLQFLQFSAEVQDGSSGSPLLDRSGNVIGVATAMLTDASQNVNYAVRGTIAEVFLDVNNISYRANRSDEILSIANVGKLARDYTVAVTCYP